MSAPTTTAPATSVAVRARRGGGTRALWLAGLYYLVAALVVTMWLWRDPASRVVAANSTTATSSRGSSGKLAVWAGLHDVGIDAGRTKVPFGRVHRSARSDRRSVRLE